MLASTSYIIWLKFSIFCTSILGYFSWNYPSCQLFLLFSHNQVACCGLFPLLSWFLGDTPAFSLRAQVWGHQEKGRVGVWTWNYVNPQGMSVYRSVSLGRFLVWDFSCSLSKHASKEWCRFWQTHSSSPSPVWYSSHGWLSLSSLLTVHQYYTEDKTDLLSILKKLCFLWFVSLFFQMDSCNL